MAYRYQGNSNLELVEALEQDGLFQDPRIRSALLKIPRGHFLPPELAEEAYVDRPLHILPFGFNVSAPHMHVICLEALDVRAGQDFLDIGSGCGFVTAVAGFLVGPKGSALGVDLNKEGVDFATNSVKDLFRRGLSLHNVSYEQRNCFLRDLQDRRWDRIHCGASCPHKLKHTLYEMLRPGGVIVTPIGNHLVRAQKDQFGFTREEKLMGVRYSELILPTRKEVAENERMISMQIQLPTSHLSQDFSKLFDNEFLSDVSFSVGKKMRTLKAHKAILVSRCEYFSAFYHSGMKGSDSSVIHVEDFSFRVFREVLRFIYTDLCQIDNVKLAGELIRAADFYRLERLKMMCAYALSQEVNAETACTILEIAHLYQSQPLKVVAHDFIVQHFDEVKKTKGYSELSPDCIREILDVVMSDRMQEA